MCFDSIKILSKEYGELKFEELVDNESDPRDKSVVLQSQSHYGFIEFRTIVHEDFNVWRNDYLLERDMHITMQSPNPSISLAFALENDYSVNVEGLAPFTSHKLDYNICFTPHLNCEYGFKKGEYAIFGIAFTPGFLRKWSDASSIIHELLNRTESKKAFMLMEHNAKLTSNMRSVINDLAHDSYSGNIRKMYLESKVLELLRLSLDNIEHVNNAPPQTILHEDDLKQIIIVHNHIHANINNPGSLAELAHLAGLNDHKLNTGFKQLYGNTVVAFILDLRMNLAKTMLQETQYSVKAISRLIGFKEMANFSAAYKKKFGYTPKETRGSNS